MSADLVRLPPEEYIDLILGIAYKAYADGKPQLCATNICNMAYGFMCNMSHDSSNHNSLIYLLSKIDLERVSDQSITGLIMTLSDGGRRGSVEPERLQLMEKSIPVLRRRGWTEERINKMLERLK